MYTAEILDRDEQGALRPQLKDMLGIIRDKGEDLYWKIAALEASGDVSPLGYTMLELEEEISSYPQGMPITWEMLWKLSAQIEDALEISLAASKTPDFDFDGRSAEFESLEIVLQLLDGSIWRVISSSEVLLQQYVRSFHGTRIEKGLA